MYCKDNEWNGGETDDPEKLCHSDERNVTSSANLKEISVDVEYPRIKRWGVCMEKCELLYKLAYNLLNVNHPPSDLFA